MEKSFTTLEQKICIITGEKYDTGALLMDKRMSKTFDMHTTTGWGISPEYQEQIDKGFIIFIGIDSEKSDVLPNGNIKPEGAYRTGEIIQIKEEAAKNIFNIEKFHPFNFVDQEVVKHLQKIYEQSQKEE